MIRYRAAKMAAKPSREHRVTKREMLRSPLNNNGWSKTHREQWRYTNRRFI